MKIADRDISFLRLLRRSKEVGDGWRNVSMGFWSLVEEFGQPELIEVKPSGDGGGRVRLTERGSIVVDYL